jgi:hypothetical protein
MRGFADSMGRLGRLIALPLLIVVMALQGLAPAQASTMARDAFGQPICTGDGVAAQPGQKKAPDQHSSHECCAAACAAAFTATAPAADLSAALTWPSQTRVSLHAANATLGPRGPPDRPPNARGPPSLA